MKNSFLISGLLSCLAFFLAPLHANAQEILLTAATSTSPEKPADNSQSLNLDASGNLLINPNFSKFITQVNDSAYQVKQFVYSFGYDSRSAQKTLTVIYLDASGNLHSRIVARINSTPDKILVRNNQAQITKFGVHFNSFEKFEVYFLTPDAALWSVIYAVGSVGSLSKLSPENLKVQGFERFRLKESDFLFMYAKSENNNTQILLQKRPIDFIWKGIEQQQINNVLNAERTKVSAQNRMGRSELFWLSEGQIFHASELTTGDYNEWSRDEVFLKKENVRSWVQIKVFNLGGSLAAFALDNTGTLWETHHIVQPGKEPTWSTLKIAGDGIKSFQCLPLKDATNESKTPFLKCELTLSTSSSASQPERFFIAGMGVREIELSRTFEVSTTQIFLERTQDNRSEAFFVTKNGEVFNAYELAPAQHNVLNQVVVEKLLMKISPRQGELPWIHTSKLPDGSLALVWFENENLQIKTQPIISYKDKNFHTWTNTAKLPPQLHP